MPASPTADRNKSHLRGCFEMHYLCMKVAVKLLIEHIPDESDLSLEVCIIRGYVVRAVHSVGFFGRISSVALGKTYL